MITTAQIALIEAVLHADRVQQDGRCERHEQPARDQTRGADPAGPQHVFAQTQARLCSSRRPLATRTPQQRHPAHAEHHRPQPVADARAEVRTDHAVAISTHTTATTISAASRMRASTPPLRLLAGTTGISAHAAAYTATPMPPTGSQHHHQHAHHHRLEARSAQPCRRTRLRAVRDPGAGAGAAQCRWRACSAGAWAEAIAAIIAARSRALLGDFP